MKTPDISYALGFGHSFMALTSLGPADTLPEETTNLRK